MEITFPGGLKVQASYKGHTILTDQPAFAGGEDSAPTPFDLFLASIGTCVGIYVKTFCEQRGIDTKNIVIKQHMQTNQQSRLISKITFEMYMPNDFPEKYKEALVHAANHCAVKRHMMNSPEFGYNIIIRNESI